MAIPSTSTTIQSSLTTQSTSSMASSRSFIGIAAAQDGMSSASLADPEKERESFFLMLKGKIASALHAIRLSSAELIDRPEMPPTPAMRQVEELVQELSESARAAFVQESVKNLIKEVLKRFDSNTKERLIREAAQLSRPHLVRLLQVRLLRQQPEASATPEGVAELQQLEEATLEELGQVMRRQEPATQEWIKEQLAPQLQTNLYKLLRKEWVVLDHVLPQSFERLLQMINGKKEAVSFPTQTAEPLAQVSALREEPATPISSDAASRELGKQLEFEEQLKQLDLNTQGHLCLESIATVRPMIEPLLPQQPRDMPTTLELLQLMVYEDRSIERWMQENVLSTFLTHLQKGIEDELLREYPFEKLMMDRLLEREKKQLS